ncbi:MAG: hypothetical protein PHU21_11490, partial [Elusimicrobia bacterium]|nr:hypothetical protein [Elusimicrobiota bacterium]
MRKAIAVLLSSALIGLSAGLQPYQAMASEVAPVRVTGSGGAAPVVPGASLKVQLQPAGLSVAPLSGLQATLQTLPAAPQVKAGNLQTPAAALPQAQPVALAAPSVVPGETPAPQNQFQQTMQRLAAPSLVQDVPAQAGSETSADAAGRDFAQRLGERPAAAAVETEALAGLSPVSGLAPAAKRTSAEASPVSLPAPAQTGKQAKSPVFPAVVAAAAALVWEGIQAAAALCGGAALHAASAAPLYTVLQAAAGVAGFTVLGAGAVFAAGALADIGSYAYGMWRGRQVADSDFWDFVRNEVMLGRMDAGVAEMLRVHRPGKVSWSMDFGFTANGSIHLRPELAATPWLFRQVLSHELRHLRANPQRGPPSGPVRGLWRRFTSELSARAGEFHAAARIARTRIPVLERALRLAQLSLSLAKPYDVLVVNATAPELANPAIYQALSAGQARVSVVQGADPQAVLGDARNARRFQAVVLDQSSVLLPQEQTPDSQRLGQALAQLDELFVLAT